MWRIATLVNFVGPGSYFTFGVKRQPASQVADTSRLRVYCAVTLGRPVMRASSLSL